MYYGEKSIIESTVKENKEVVLKIPISKELLDALNKDPDIINEVASGYVVYDKMIKVYFTDAGSGSRGQIIKDNKRQMQHGNRVKVIEPKEYSNLDIVIPKYNEDGTTDPVYLAKGKDPYTKPVSDNLKKAVECVQKDRKYYDIIFSHPADVNQQVRAFKQMIKKDSDITFVKFHGGDKETNKELNDIINKRKE